MAYQHCTQQNPSSAKQHLRLKLLLWHHGLASLKQRQRKQNRETVPCDFIFTAPYQSNSDVDIELDDTLIKILLWPTRKRFGFGKNQNKMYIE
ncbi:unnamed protein product [Rotaria socialis]|uniref:Uncharacterized protein n=1 Tax=Rotaria socialis TaxID=392032 RepID=A0A820MZ32_9BILA|nr:unnamed protein product [Rotaria socialis]CAF4658629.1 unnamed protein product [Rotaria socialis]CAF4729495.1 unnamed protein product [Rotaria socialis]